MDKRPKKNRRLELLPEVLPPPPKPGKLNPRERTLKSLGRLAAAAAAAATLSACKETGCGSGGYAVVDPMPPPAQCEGLVATISAFTTWNSAGNITLKLSKPTLAGASYNLPAAPPTDAGPDASPALGAAPGAIRVNHGHLVAVSQAGGALVLEIAPDPGTSYVAVEVPATCPAGEETVLAEIRLERGTDPKPKLSVALYDQSRY